MAVVNVGPTIQAEIQWREQEYAYDVDGNVEYRGASLWENASRATGDFWWIWKYSYTNGLLTGIKGRGWYNWDDRAGLNWS